MTAAKNPLIEPLGEAALQVTLGDEIGISTSAAVLGLRCAVLEANLPGVTDCIPAYTSLLVRYDPTWAEVNILIHTLAELCANKPAADTLQGRLVEIPVIYGGEFGPDLADVAANAGKTVGDVIRLHAAGDYTVAFLGFLPGFPYMIGLDPRLACPRLATPRQIVTAGSVGIAGGQTGIYPLDSPGGWRIIGRTTLRLFDHTRGQPELLRPGDRVRFVLANEGATL
jgi:inhibitor of KinA